MTAPSHPSPYRPAPAVRARHPRVPEAGAPPGPTTVIPRPRLQGPVPVAVRPPAPPPVRPGRVGPPPAGLATGSLPGLYGPPPTSGRTCGFAVASLVTALLAVLCVLASFMTALVAALTAVVLGAVALHRTSATGDGGRGLAWAGLAVGGILTLLGGGLLVVGILMAVG